MTELTREAKLSNAFVMLADTLVADFDLLDLLQTLVETCTDLLDAVAGGLLLRSAMGELQVLASTTEDAEFVEVVQLGAAAGPCWECAATGEPLTIGDIEATGDRWPAFREAALQRGYRAVHATPLRLRSQVVGTMNLFNTSVGALNDQDIAAAQALSDVATIGILSSRAAQERNLITAQLQQALDSRVVIEQAKGVIAQATGLSMDDSFTSLRSFARNNNLSLRSVATALIDRRLDVARMHKARPAGQLSQPDSDIPRAP
ncbi:ANTAR domain-containing protein [uncultured Amnibacterium sp.]|uniref:ANTAR domain-containing protein n=1 Tax=uncultured Amnibacterium sp. TaxID=1631851 RepID=UPI0035C97FA6